MWLVSGLLVLSTFLPFVILNKSGKGDLKIMSKKIKDLVDGTNLKFDVKENWANSFIGIDTRNNTLVFSKVFDGAVAVDSIDLNDIRKSGIVKKTHIAKSKNKKETVLESLDLEIWFLDEKKENKILGFYDMDSIYVEDYEVRRAEKWNTLINDALSTSSKGIK